MSEKYTHGLAQSLAKASGQRAAGLPEKTFAQSCAVADVNNGFHDLGEYRLDLQRARVCYAQSAGFCMDHTG